MKNNEPFENYEQNYARAEEQIIQALRDNMITIDNIDFVFGQAKRKVLRNTLPYPNI